MVNRMPQQLDRVVPWGRSFDEYAAMFDLKEADYALRILGCGDGPASFNAEMAYRGWRVVSVDPVYALPAHVIRQRVRDVYERMVQDAREHRDRFVWKTFASPEALGAARLAALERFLCDLLAGGTSGRYAAMALPHLGFADGVFDLALVSHLMFLYTAQLSQAWHIAAALELCRVAGEVRIFPLLDLEGKPSAHLPLVRAAVEAGGRSTRLARVPYEFLRGADTMLVIS